MRQKIQHTPSAEGKQGRTPTTPFAFATTHKQGCHKPRWQLGGGNDGNFALGNTPQRLGTTPTSMEAELARELLAAARGGVDLKRKFSELKTDPDARYFVYVLQLEGGFVYCGSTDNIYTRYHQHLSGDGTSQAVKAFGPVTRLVRVYADCGVLDEKFVTMEQMADWGFAKVRGAGWCKVEPLSAEPPEVRSYKGGSIQGKRLTRAEVDEIHARVSELLT